MLAVLVQLRRDRPRRLTRDLISRDRQGPDERIELRLDAARVVHPAVSASAFVLIPSESFAIRVVRSETICAETRRAFSTRRVASTST